MFVLSGEHYLKYFSYFNKINYLINVLGLVTSRESFEDIVEMKIFI